MSKCGQDIEISIQVLDENTKKYAEDFKCGNENIDYYFNKEAVDDTTSVTYLYIDNATDKLVACITLACSAIFYCRGNGRTVFYDTFGYGNKVFGYE